MILGGERCLYEDLVAPAERVAARLPAQSRQSATLGKRGVARYHRRMNAGRALRVAPPAEIFNAGRRHDDGRRTSAAIHRSLCGKRGWPDSSKPGIFDDSSSLEPSGPGGGVRHANAVVAACEAVFITSTNLPEPALDRSIGDGPDGSLSCRRRDRVSTSPGPD